MSLIEIDIDVFDEHFPGATAKFIKLEKECEWMVMVHGLKGYPIPKNALTMPNVLIYAILDNDKHFTLEKYRPEYKYTTVALVYRPDFKYLDLELFKNEFHKIMKEYFVFDMQS